MTASKMFLFLVPLILSEVSCLKILVIFPMPAKSHYILGNELAKGLAKAGHEVTIVSTFTEKNPPKNYKEISLTEMAAAREEQSNTMNMFQMENISPIWQVLFMNFIGGTFTDIFFSQPKIQKLLQSKEHFDVVIVEQFLNDALKIFAYHFKAPLVLFSTVGPNKWVNKLVGNPEPISYIPDMFLSFSSDMTFFERMYNLLFSIFTELNQYYYYIPQQRAFLKKYYPNAPDLYEIQYEVSLILTNSHESIGQAVPHVPNMIDIGGYHVNPQKNLPKELKDFLDNAKEGVIYFSLGSNLIPSQMPKDKLDAILKVLGSRKEKVLWKWDQDNLPNQPANVRIDKWFPQQEILAHPNTKLFITHGGLLSTTETVYLGVPVLAFPIFGDQKLNAERVVTLGFGKSLAFSQIREDNLAESLHEVLENPKYREKAKLRSRIMHDRPVKPMDLATYWIEYVVRYEGAPHLRVAGTQMPLYKYLLLDVIGFIVGTLLLFVYALKKLCCIVFHRKKSIATKVKQS